MAGTSQAGNLGGMLSQMAGAYSGWGDKAADTFGEQIKGMTRPELNENSAESLQNYANWARNTGNKEEALIYSKRAGEVRAEEATRATGAAIASIEQRMLDVLKQPGLSPEQQQQSLNALQDAATRLAANTPGMDPTAVAGMAMEAENAVFQQAEAKRQSDREAKSLEIREKQLGLSERQLIIGEQQHKEWMNNASTRTLLRQVEQQEAQTKLHFANLSKIIKDEKATDAYLVANPEASTLVDEMRLDIKEREVRAAELKEKLSDTTFKYDVDEIAKEFKLSDDSKAMLKRLSTESPASANKYVVGKYLQQLEGKAPEIPPAAMVAVFKDAAMERAAQILKLDLDPEDEEDFARIESLASQIALEGASVYSRSGGNFGEATNAMLGYKPKKGESDGADGDVDLAELTKLAEELIKQRQEGID